MFANKQPVSTILPRADDQYVSPLSYETILLHVINFCFDFFFVVKYLSIVLKTANFQNNETIYLNRLKQLQVHVNSNHQLHVLGDKLFQ